MKILTLEDSQKGFHIDSKGNIRSKHGRLCISATCPVCKRIFLADKRSRKTNPLNQQIFCSRECFFKSPHYKPPVAKGSRSWNWKGGLTNRYGYLYYSYGENQGKAVHSLIAEKILGRSLKQNEQVHHINGIKSDNRNCNLLICTRAYHSWLEHKLSSLYKQEHFFQNK